MSASIKRSKKLLILFSVLYLSCKDPEALTVDYYSHVMPFCAGDAPSASVLCREKLMEVIVLDETYTGKADDILLLQDALYSLLKTPVLMPEKTLSDEFRAFRNRFPQYSWNQILFDYVLNSTDKFILLNGSIEPYLGISVGGYYDGNIHLQQIDKSKNAVPIDFPSETYAGILLHEATHAYGNHNVACPKTGNLSLSFECDLGLNLPFGRDLSYTLGRIRAELSLPNPDEVKLVFFGKYVCSVWSHIYGISAEFKQRGDKFCAKLDQGSVLQVDSYFY